MIKFEMTQLFPRFLRNDVNGYAMCKAIEKALQIADEVIQTGVDAVQDVSKMPEWRLDEMAWEMDAQWYDYDEDLETKRKQINNAMSFYNRLGTPYAIRSAIEAVYGSGMLKEWFDYDGEPYHFKIFTTNNEALSQKLTKFMTLVERVKNLRSVLDGVEYYGSDAKATINVGAAAVGFAAAVYARTSSDDFWAIKADESATAAAAAETGAATAAENAAKTEAEVTEMSTTIAQSDTQREIAETMKVYSDLLRQWLEKKSAQ